MKLENYSDNFEPPAPLIRMQISSFGTGLSREIDALVDTGSDQTLVHWSILEEIESSLGQNIVIQSATGMASYATAFVRITIEGLPPFHLDVVGFDFNDHAILGRDFLNHFKLTLDGPNLLFSIE
jgi:predicted aspartyl protease